MSARPKNGKAARAEALPATADASGGAGATGSKAEEPEHWPLRPLRPLPLRRGAVAWSGGAAKTADSARAAGGTPRQVSVRPPSPTLTAPPAVKRRAASGVSREAVSHPPACCSLSRLCSLLRLRRHLQPGLFALYRQVESAVAGIPVPSPASSCGCCTCEWQGFIRISALCVLRSPRL